MRTEKEMMNCIIKTAEEDPRIRAAYIEGSRTNPNVPKDIFQDYDIVYVVKETKPFRDDRKWIDRFGERLYMQYPEEGVYWSSDVENSYGWLMQFADGNRLDLHVSTEAYALSHLEMYRTLVDKDDIMPDTQDASEEQYWTKKPRSEEFQCTCNEFWWCLNNVAKGLWREELLYVMDMIEFNIRPMLKRVLEWKIAVQYDFSINLGKSGKYMKNYLSQKVYEQFLSTYANADQAVVWDAVFVMCDMFQETAIEVSRKLNFDYNYKEAENSRSFLNHVKELPAYAKEIYVDSN